MRKLGGQLNPRHSPAVPGNAIELGIFGGFVRKSHMLSIDGVGPDLSAKYSIPDSSIDQHQRQDEQTLSPEHKRESASGRRGLVNCD